jgi:hypothetical protein
MAQPSPMVSLTPPFNPEDKLSQPSPMVALPPATPLELTNNLAQSSRSLSLFPPVTLPGLPNTLEPNTQPANLATKIVKTDDRKKGEVFVTINSINIKCSKCSNLLSHSHEPHKAIVLHASA